VYGQQHVKIYTCSSIFLYSGKIIGFNYNIIRIKVVKCEDLDGPAVSAIAKQRSQWSVKGWVTKIYYLELLRASEVTLSRWFCLQLQSLASTPISRMVDVRQAAGRKNNCRISHSLIKKHVVLTSLTGVRVRKIKEESSEL
jgi:hypothetical protein